MTKRILTAIGLMSGTSLDGIDAAIVRTDGMTVASLGAASTTPYDAAVREGLRGLLGRDPRGEPRAASVVRAMTEAHARAVVALLAKARLPAGKVDVLGFHGQTLFHAPARGMTVQVGDGDLLAQLTGIPVVDDFRSRDVEAGGEGAPLVPLFHAALAESLERPLAVLNIGGVANVTWIGADAGVPLAFDTGPGNALLDDWMRSRTGRSMDVDGVAASAGRVDDGWLHRSLGHPYFSRRPPKSLDRDAFQGLMPEHLSTEDGAASLAAFTAEAVARAVAGFPEAPKRWLVCGGGRRNPAIMAALARRLAAPVAPVEAVGWSGDELEAQAFGFLAVRSLRGLPLSLPTTTGVSAPTEGGRYHATPDRPHPIG